jgi:hypothetical protein
LDQIDSAINNIADVSLDLGWNKEQTRKLEKLHTQLEDHRLYISISDLVFDPAQKDL